MDQKMPKDKTHDRSSSGSRSSSSTKFTRALLYSYM